MTTPSQPPTDDTQTIRTDRLHIDIGGKVEITLYPKGVSLMVQGGKGVVVDWVLLSEMLADAYLAATATARPTRAGAGGQEA